jgi:hypothetical protein
MGSEVDSSVGALAPMPIVPTDNDLALRVLPIFSKFRPL